MRFSITFFLFTFLIPFVSQAEDFFENFDSTITPPALPASWSSTSGSGLQSWTTTNTSSWTSPNSAFVPAALSPSDTRLTTPSISYPGSIGPVLPVLTFSHRYLLTDTYSLPSTSTYDGATLEISIDGGAFTDIIDAGGSFKSGGYNYTIASVSNPLNLRRAWAGSLPSYSIVEANLPAINPGSSFRIRFRLGTDSIIGSTGWFIDNVRVTPKIETATTLAPSTSEIVSGKTLSYTFGITNNSKVPLNQIGGFILSSANPIVSFTNVPGVAYSSFNAQGSFVQLSSTVLPGETRAFSFAIQTSKPRTASGVLRITAPAEIADTSVIVTPALFSPLTSTSGISARLESASDAVGNPLDICEPVSNPAAIAGKIAVIATPLGCSIMTKALHAQAAGALAVIVSDFTFISPPVDEPVNAALTIPVVVLSVANTDILFSSVLEPFLPNVDFNLLVSRDIVSLQVSGFGGDGNETRFTDNIVTAVTALVDDSDEDGTPDPRDACPLDAAKISLGQCGCGVTDVDTNSNGIAQCRSNADFQERLTALSKATKKLNGKNTSSQKLLKQSIRNLAREINSITRAPSPVITTTSASINLRKLGSTVSKEITKLLSSYSRAQRAKSLQAISKLQKGVNT